jgi:hypothetical protein
MRRGVRENEQYRTEHVDCLNSIPHNVVANAYPFRVMGDGEPGAALGQLGKARR